MAKTVDRPGPDNDGKEAQKNVLAFGFIRLVSSPILIASNRLIL